MERASVLCYKKRSLLWWIDIHDYILCIALQSYYIAVVLYSDDMVEKELDIKLDITKKSRRINRPVQFADQHGNIMEEVRSDLELQAQYIPRNPVSRVIQCAAVQSENEVTAFDYHLKLI